MTARLVLMAVCLAACNRQRTFAPPPQQDFDAPVRHAAFAADPDVGPLLVSDIGPLEGGRFRWTTKNPTVRLWLTKTEGIRLEARFWIAPETLVQTGPIEIAYLVNGETLDRVRYSRAGEQQFVKPVDAAWLKAENEVRLELDKIYENGTQRLGIALVELGFAD